MNKQEFLDKLKAALSELPYAEVEKSLAFYSELIDDKAESGMTEEEAVASMEPVETIAQQIMMEQPMGTVVAARAKDARRGLSTAAVIIGAPLWVVAAIVLFALVIVFYVVIWAILITLWAVFAAFAVGGLGATAVSVYLIFTNPSIGWLGLGGGLVLSGLAILMFFADLALSKLTVRFTAWLWRSVKKLFIRKKVA